MKRIILYLLLTLGLIACAPQLNTKAQLVILNGPADYYVPGVAKQLSNKLKTTNPNPSYSIVRSSRTEFAETHRDMFGSRANPSASLIANTYGAEFAILIGAPLFERNINKNDQNQKIYTKVQLEVRIIDPVTQQTLANYASPLFYDVRTEALDAELPEIKDDPDIQKLIKQGIKEISPQVSQDIESLFQRITPPHE